MKSSHGSTVGQLPESHLFYLKSRGLSADEARVMLMEGFVEEIVMALPPEDAELQKSVETAVLNALKRVSRQV